ncbi:ribose-5-phosphate isomerase RpiA [Bacillaceae bacterium SIJ1]|uniref:ribose-5-phosphate isomerase RpiA n=1 Tax=Litoribacterium kuwaitense TaxID=1398745 RepID=UPI0013EB3A3F|nr:ribose-5-phosphate isomerase RpiA [Litoribacterium kuwaitense]NGP44296.1 ribose-5-phosphate isomerase RpiA [Litoribacterium kuwaitense]
MSKEIKKLVGDKAAAYVEDGMTLGLGTGSTVYWTIEKIGEMVQQGLKVQGIPTSIATEEQAKRLGIPLVTFRDVSHIDVTIDGADEVDPELQLIKGGGGALLREKMVAMASTRVIIVADESKIVDRLGQFPLPVEVVTYGLDRTAYDIEQLGGKSTVRKKDGETYMTDNGNIILDCDFYPITAPEKLSQQLNMLPGVVENGLFTNIADTVLVGTAEGRVIIK